MEREEFDVRKNILLDVKRICNKKGIYGNVVSYDPFAKLPGLKKPKLYIVASPYEENITAVLPDNVRPDEIVRRNKRENEIFFTDCWAWDMSEGNRQQALIELINYSNALEFLKRVCDEFSSPLPKKLRITEINNLIVFYKAYDSTRQSKNSEYKYAKKVLEDFFAKENSKNKLTQHWLDFYRSEKFPQNKGKLAQLKCFLTRHKNITDKNVLMENCIELHTLEMDEHEYKELATYLKKHHPEITYAISDKIEINTGGLGKVDPSTNPPTKYVSNEDFASIMKTRFADEGWDCIKNLKVCYWVNRKIYYNSADEPVIAGIFNYITHQFTNAIDVSKLSNDDKLSLHKIYKADFMNFVSEASAQDLDYAIDFKGRYAKPSLEFINVITRTSDNNIVQEIIDSNLEFKADYTIAANRL